MPRNKVVNMKAVYTLIHVVKVRVAASHAATPGEAAVEAIARLRHWIAGEKYWKGFSLVDACPNAEIGLDACGGYTRWIVRCTLVKKADDKELRPWAGLLDPVPMTPWEKKEERRAEAWSRSKAAEAFGKMPKDAKLLGGAILANRATLKAAKKLRKIVVGSGEAKPTRPRKRRSAKKGGK